MDYENKDYGPPTNYAHFGWRLLAHIIDGMLISIIYYVALAIFGGAAFMSAGGMDAIENGGDMDPSVAMGLAGGMMAMSLMLVVAVWLYYAIMESSVRQATVGKMALKMKVTDMHGDRISFLRATGRFFGKIISGAIMGIGYLMNIFTEKKQTLHDMMASTLVLKED